MPRGDKSSYTDKQKRQAEHIEKGYEQRGVAKAEAQGRAWATVNKETGGGKKSGGSGRGKAMDTKPSRDGGTAGGKASASRSPEQRSASARKGAATRKRNAAKPGA
ncbi:MAG: plasmid stabilization protein [Pseudomonadota bacterium]